MRLVLPTLVAPLLVSFLWQNTHMCPAEEMWVASSNLFQLSDLFLHCVDLRADLGCLVSCCVGGGLQSVCAPLNAEGERGKLLAPTLICVVP